LGVVLGGRRSTPNGHHRVADELLDGAAVQRDQPLAAVEVAGEQLPRVLGVAALGERREADEIGEEHRDELPLGGGLGGGRGGFATQHPERSSAFGAERVAELRGASAGRAGECEAGAALDAELRAGPVFGPTARAGHAATPASTARPARSSQGVASRRSKISYASASSGSASAARPWPLSHSPCSSWATARSTVRPCSRKTAAAVWKPGSTPSYWPRAAARRARKRAASAVRNGGRLPGGITSIRLI